MLVKPEIVASELMISISFLDFRVFLKDECAINKKTIAIADLQLENAEKGICSNMKLKIKFEKPDDILKFVNEADKFPCEMDLCYGSYIVDAKSVLGVMLLGIGKVLILNIYSDKGKEIELSLSRYQVA